MAQSFKQIFGTVKAAAQDFSDDKCPQMAAALSYYTVFSLPPLLLIIVTILGVVFGEEAARGQIQSQVSGLLGPEAAAEFEGMIENTNRKLEEGTGVLATILGIGALLIGATGAFMQLQDALNTAWEVKPDPEKGGIKNMVLKRFLSFGMILAIGFLLLVSLLLSAAINAFGEMLQGSVPGLLSEPLLSIVNNLVSLVVITLLFGALFKVLPDARIAWRDVWLGGFVTALLFVIGKFALGFYLGNSDVGGAFGAAGSLALILVWIYYSSMIFLFGAEFTQAWVRAKGGTIQPDSDAVRVVTETRHVRSGEQQPGGTAPSRS